jgi:hypothetical protein
MVDELVRLDLGCGKNKRDGFIGVDTLALAGVDVVADLRQTWTWADNSVDEIHCSHFVEHLTSVERCHFVNEMHRVLKVGSKATVIVPSWASNRAYGDPTHQWPPVSEMWFYYLSQEWRDTQAPHTDAKNWPQGFACDFEATWGYGMHPQLLTRNVEFQQFALNFYKEAAQDIHATLTKKG